MNYLRQCFCKHDWLVEEFKANRRKTIGGVTTTDPPVSTTLVYMRCKKCGYHKSHDKFAI